MIGQRLNLQVPGQNPPNPPQNARQPVGLVRGPRGRQQAVARAQQPPPNIPPYNYEYDEFNVEHHLHAIKKLKKYTPKGMYHNFYLGETLIKCKMVPEYGFETFYDDIILKPIIDQNDLKEIKINYRTMFISSECMLKIKKYPELFESLCWNVISRSHISPGSYSADLWYHTTDIINDIPMTSNRIYDIIRAYYEKVGIKEITALRVIYFKETFALLVNRMMTHIKLNLLDSDIMNTIRASLPKFVGAIICLYGKKCYDEIMGNIDEFLKYTTQDCINMFHNYYLSSAMNNFLQNTYESYEKNHIAYEEDD